MTLTEMQNSVTTVNEAWNRIKVEANKKQTFGGVVLIWRMLNKIFDKDREQMLEKVEGYYTTFAKDLADEKATGERKNHADLVEANQKKLHDLIVEAGDSKTAQVDALISKTGDPELTQLVKDLSMRTEVSDREWQAIAVRISAAHDYQAGRLLADIAPRFDKYYKVPFDPDEEIKQIELAKGDLFYALKEIDTPKKDWSLRTMHIMGEYDHLTAQQERFERLDTAIGVAAPQKVKSLIERLQEAMEIARANGDNAAANKISGFIYDKAEYVDNRKVIAEFYKEEAEKLITKALSVVNGR